MKSDWDKMKNYLNKDVKLCMSLDIKGLSSFIEYWAGIYFDTNETLYTNNIRKKLTDKSVEQLYLWKSGPQFYSKERIKNYLNNYKTDLLTQDNLQDKYLNHKKSGGAIWNIFYLHIISPEKYPIFDQHVYRTMRFMQAKDSKQSQPFTELEFCDNQYKFEAYEKYRTFYKNIESDTRACEFLNKTNDPYGRKIDMALFSFGAFLKKSCNYKRYF